MFRRVGVHDTDWFEEQDGTLYRRPGAVAGPVEAIGPDSEEARSELVAAGAWFFSDYLMGRFEQAAERARALGLDCKSCGACCNSRIPAGPFLLVNIPPADAARVERKHPGVTWDYDGKERQMLDVPTDIGSACICFQGTPGRACACGIYQDRPQPCWVFPAGFEECLKLRRAILPACGITLSDAELAMPTEAGARS